MKPLPSYLRPLVAALGSLALATLGTGCSTTLARMDQHNLRGSMMIYQEDQIMDNLIRSYNFLPIMHFDVEQMDAKVTTKMNGSLDLGETVTNGPLGLTEVVRPLKGMLGGNRDNEITLTVKAKLDANEIYAAYSYFVHEVRGLRVLDSGQSRDKDNEVIGRKWYGDGKWYYVPKEYGPTFYEMCLRVAVMRGTADPKLTAVRSGTTPGTAASSGGRKKITPLSAPQVTTPMEKTVPGAEAIQQELRKIRLFPR